MDSPSPSPGIMPFEALLENFIPGYSFFAQLVSSYFRTDISSYILVVVASFALWTYAAETLRGRLQSFILSFATAVEIRYNDDLYNDAMRWISSRPDLSQAQRVVAGTRMNLSALWSDEEVEEDELSEQDQALFEENPRQYWFRRKYLDKTRRVRYTPAPLRIHYFKYEGRWLLLCRQPYEPPRITWVANMENLHFYTAPWNKNVLRKLISDMQKTSSDQESDCISIRRGLRLGYNFEWVRVATKKPRALSTIILDHGQKKCLINDIQEYLHPSTRSWYQSRGFPYRRGYLFHGPPGTGKSSLCFGIASLVHLDIFMLSLRANHLDENSLALLFQSLPKRCIVLFEDVDQAGMPKRRMDNTVRREGENLNDEDAPGDEFDTENRNVPSNGITLSAFLNVIDGVSAQEGRILIMTTNDVGKLDDALLRPGRIDMTVHFGCADSLAIQEHFLAFYMKPADAHVMGLREPNGYIRPQSSPACSKWTTEIIIQLAAIFAKEVPPQLYSAAELQSYLLRYRKRPLAAVCDVSRWLGKQSNDFDIHHEADLSQFRIQGFPDRFKVHGRVVSIRVSAVIFTWQHHVPLPGANGRAEDPAEPRALLVKRAPGDSKAGYWESGPGGCVESGDATLQEAIKREVAEETGLHLSDIVRPLSVQKWSRPKPGELREWIGFSYIINVSDTVPKQAIQADIVLNPEEHESFAWATEAEIRDGKYEFYGNHQDTILEAFAMEKKLCLRYLLAETKGRE
ncbi:hypothetical protein BDV59DRAFT_209007 [Aspergillus ambiguus]|uniref:uncharacterized protein n=1 Tax=Aspergillus ambiguus TaxID=176160 RepID=UPI003CCD0386